MCGKFPGFFFPLTETRLGLKNMEMPMGADKNSPNKSLLSARKDKERGSLARQKILD